MTYYVRTDGSDSNDGSANDAAHAFRTMEHASAVASSGDTINVTTNLTSTGPIIKNGVNWSVGAGITITSSNADGFFYDPSNPEDGPVDPLNYTVSGHGDFSVVGPAILVDWGSTVSFSCKSIISTSVLLNQLILVTGGSTLTLTVDERLYDPVYDALWATNGGTIHVTCPLVETASNGNAIEVGGGAPSLVDGTIGTLSSPDRTFNMTAGGTVTLTSNVVKSTGSGIVIDNNGGTLTLTCPSVVGQLWHRGGASTIIGATIDASGFALAGVLVNAAGVTLSNCRVRVAHSQTYSMSAASPQTVTVVGALTVNKPIHPNITIAGGTVSVVPDGLLLKRRKAVA